MIAFPAGTKVWIAGGVTDMRCGMNALSLKVQQGLGRDPHSGVIFCFRGRKADVVKLLWFDGVGVSLYAKRLLWLPPIVQEVFDPFGVWSSAVFCEASRCGVPRSRGPGW